MLFNSFIFFIFLGFVLPVFYLLPSKKSKNVFLLLASYFFYGYWDWRFCLLLLGSTIVDFVMGKKMEEERDVVKRKRLLWLSLVINLGVLGVFKYYNFFVDSLLFVSEKIGWHLDYLHLNILLPVGISFYTFQTLSYTIDIYRKRLEPTTNIVDFALFVSFFPQLVAGPIERASALLPQLARKLTPTKRQLRDGVTLIVLGLFRKVMIGDTLGRIVDPIFVNMEYYKSIELITALVLFSFQIYADFSGYSHMARGVSKLLGVELMKNFEQPYLSNNITEFWRRWHISLSSWLKDYLYITLGGNRKGHIKTYRNLMLTMLLGGLWHGANWNFVIWGGLHGICLAFHKIILTKCDEKSLKESSTFSFQNIVKITITYALVLVTWLFFRSTDWSDTVMFISKLIHWETSDLSIQFMTILISYAVLLLLMDVLEYRFKSHVFVWRLKSKGAVSGILFGLFLITIIYMFQADPLPFIYFQF